MASTTSIEREQKFEAPEEFELPDFAALPDTTVLRDDEVDLTAIYFDTPDLRLARGGGELAAPRRRGMDGQAAGGRREARARSIRGAVRGEPGRDPDEGGPARNGVVSIRPAGSRRSSGDPPSSDRARRPRRTAGGGGRRSRRDPRAGIDPATVSRDRGRAATGARRRRAAADRQPAEGHGRDGKRDRDQDPASPGPGRGPPVGRRCRNPSRHAEDDARLRAPRRSSTRCGAWWPTILSPGWVTIPKVFIKLGSRRGASGPT